MTPNNRLLPLIAVLLLSAPAADATLAKAATFEQKVDNAQSIILGKCVGTISRFDPSGRWILTYSTFHVEQTMKGVALPEVVVMTPGGQIGSLHQSTIGIPSFQPGTEHVVFVKNTRLGATVLYFDQGAYDVKADARGERIVTPAPSSLVTIDPQRGIAVAPDAPRPLPEFERQVHDTLRRLEDRHIQMDAAAAENARQQESFWSEVSANRWWIALALAGVAFATWRLLRH
ncbi:MAG TPA: hypothetical protein VKH35_03460 [Thermoanaerobaculia bacterium]|jgi:hypothetical protein|nr:hypothetical protein [Thermoanaerobaculia bacterium]